MLMTTVRSCGCRGCSLVIQAGERVSWIEGIGPFHIDCSPSQEDKDLIAGEMEEVKHHFVQLEPRPKIVSKYTNTLVSVVIALTIAWFLVGGRVSLALSECSYGLARCVVGIAAAVGIVDVYDSRNRCIGIGCNF